MCNQVIWSIPERKSHQPHKEVAVLGIVLERLKNQVTVNSTLLVLNSLDEWYGLGFEDSQLQLRNVLEMWRSLYVILDVSLWNQIYRLSTSVWSIIFSSGNSNTVSAIVPGAQVVRGRLSFPSGNQTTTFICHANCKGFLINKFLTYALRPKQYKTRGNPQIFVWWIVIVKVYTHIIRTWVNLDRCQY
jgi:hypothetical protein